MASRWKDLVKQAPDIADNGARCLVGQGGEVAILATLGGDGLPRVAPVCPILTTEGLFLSLAAHTPKVAALLERQAYALHAQVGASDIEFQVRGHVRQVTSAEERSEVHAAISFPEFGRDDPVVELLIAACLLAQPGKPAQRFQG